jgi:hypothetical protein
MSDFLFKESAVYTVQKYHKKGTAMIPAVFEITFAGIKRLQT